MFAAHFPCLHFALPPHALGTGLSLVGARMIRPVELWPRSAVAAVALRARSLSHRFPSSVFFASRPSPSFCVFLPARRAEFAFFLRLPTRASRSSLALRASVRALRARTPPSPVSSHSPPSHPIRATARPSDLLSQRTRLGVLVFP